MNFYGRRRTDVHPGTSEPQAAIVVSPLYANAFEAAIAFAAMVTALVFVFNPHDPQAAVARQLGGWAWLWNILYGVGGFGVLVGLVVHGRNVSVWGKRVAGDGRVELAGMICLTTALLVNFISISRVTLNAPSTATFAALVIAFCARIRVIMKARAAPDLTGTDR